MSEMAVIGGNEFIVGFELIGVRKAFEATPQNVLEVVARASEDESVGIIIVEESLLAHVHAEDRRRIEDCVRPVTVALSTESTSQSLRQSIIRAIGVDLMKEEE